MYLVSVLRHFLTMPSSAQSKHPIGSATGDELASRRRGRRSCGSRARLRRASPDGCFVVVQPLEKVQNAYQCRQRASN